MHKKFVFLFLLSTVCCMLPFTANSKEKTHTQCLVVHQEQLQKHYQTIIQYYKTKKYSKAIALIEEILPSFSGKKELPMLQIYQAYCSYYTKDYLVSADQFKEFSKRYPKHSAIEEAIFMHGYALSYTMPDIRLDQSDTVSAIEALNKYLEKFPMGTHRTCVLTCLEKLNNNLMQKDLASAAFYYDSGKYHAALISLQNFQKEYPNSSLEEQVCYLKTKIQYELSQEKNQEKNKQLRLAISYCNDFVLQYPNSKNVQDIKKLLIKLSNNNLYYALKLEKLNNNDNE